MVDHTRITYLLNQVAQQRTSSDECRELIALLHSDKADEVLEELDQYYGVNSINTASTAAIDLQYWKAAVKEVLRADKINKEGQVITLPSKGRRLLRSWRWVAAAMLVFASGLGVYYFNNQSSAIIGGTGETSRTEGDVAPGTNRAVLTINNTQNIDLATNKTGININNTITYSDGEKIADAGQLLQLTTPRGGQYQAVLPDGSKVWLNAASSIKFPSKFTDKERRMEITGEAYFEIAKDPTKPFKVIGGEQEIEVLGTSFNINIYDDEPIKKTTLITGRIKITSNNQTAILQPGQQANISILEIPKIRLIQVQTNDIIAWKNGRFNMEGLTLDAFMRQVARWYDLDIQYNSPIPSKKFKGEMGRDLALTELLDILTQFNIKYSIKGRTLILE